MQEYTTEKTDGNWSVSWTTMVLIFVFVFLLILILAVNLRFQSNGSEPIDQKHFTELYITDVRQFEAEDSEEVVVLFSFTIHNLEGEERAYTYTVSFEKTDETTIIDEGTVTLVDTMEKSTLEYYASDTLLEEEGKLVVELPTEEQRVTILLPLDEDKYE